MGSGVGNSLGWSILQHLQVYPTIHCGSGWATNRPARAKAGLEGILCWVRVWHPLSACVRSGSSCGPCGGAWETPLSAIAPVGKDVIQACVLFSWAM